MATSYDIARLFLSDIGAPVTDGMTRAVAIWLRFESGGVVRGNNPWNLHSGPVCSADKGYCPGQGNLPGQIGNRYAGPGDKNVAVFGTIDAGVKAAAVNLTKRPAGDYTGYDKVVAAARANDPVGFLTALQNSKWSAGHYGYSKLVSAYHSAIVYNQTIKFVDTVGHDVSGSTVVLASDTQMTQEQAIAFIGSLGIDTTLNHQLTEADIDKLAAKYNVDPGLYRSSLLGKTTKDLAEILMKGGNINFDPTQIPGNVVDAVAGWAEELGRILGFLLDIENIGYSLALIAGAILVAYGTKQIIAATGSENSPRVQVIESVTSKDKGKTITRQTVKKA